MKDRWNGADLIEKKVRTRPSFASTVKDVVGGSNGYSGKFGDEEASMLLVDGKGVAHFLSIITMIIMCRKLPH